MYLLKCYLFAHIPCSGEDLYFRSHKAQKTVPHDANPLNPCSLMIIVQGHEARSPKYFLSLGACFYIYYTGRKTALSWWASSHFSLASCLNRQFPGRVCIDSIA